MNSVDRPFHHASPAATMKAWRSRLPLRRDLRRLRAAPPELYFVGSAVFHYLGPAFAVLLFARVEPLGVAWLRIASAGALFAVWRRPWRALRTPRGAPRGRARSGSCSR